MAELTVARIWVGIRPRPVEPHVVLGFQFDTTQNTLSAVGDVTRTAYSFDRVFTSTSSSREVYECSTQRVVEGVLAGINGTVFAYGQTGSGKTFTMSAITRMAVVDMFDRIAVDSENKYTLKFSIIELYCEKVKDLLREDKVDLRLTEDPVRGWIVDGVTEAVIESPEQFNRLLMQGEARRATGVTAMNERSSRSHLMLSLWVECVEVAEVGVEPASRLACLNLVDLAGSEGQKTSQTTGQRLTEGKDINLSLLALSKMLRDCSEAPGIMKPYRDSKLTMLLRSAIGGNCWTAMLGCIAPNPEHREQSLQTLDFASRAKMISNKVTVNVLEDPLTAMTRENLRLKRQVEGLQIKNASLTARVRRTDTVTKNSNGGRPTPCKETPRATPLRHSHGGTPFGNWSAAKFMASVKRPLDLTTRKSDMFSTHKRLNLKVDEDEDEGDMVPATPLPVKPLIPVFHLEDGSPLPQLMEMVPESRLDDAQSRVAQLTKENEALKSQLEEITRKEAFLIAEKYTLTENLAKSEELCKQLQLALSTLQQDLTRTQIVLAKRNVEQAEKATEQAQKEAQHARAQAKIAAAQPKESEAKLPYRDREREMAMEWRQERMKMKEKHAQEVAEILEKHEEDNKAAVKTARELVKQHKATLAEMAAKEKVLLVALEAAQKELKNKSENVVPTTAKRKVAESVRSKLSDITASTVTKRRIDATDCKAAKLAFASTTKKPKPIRLEYKIDKKPTRRTKIEAADIDLEEVRTFMIKEVTRRDEAIAKTKRRVALVNEVEKNLWRNHNFGTEFSKDLMPEGESDLIVESILWAEVIQEEGVSKVMLRCRFLDWWNSEYVGHMPDAERDAYVATLDKDLGADVLLENLDAPDLLQYFMKNLVTRQQWQTMYDQRVKEAQRKEAAEVKKKSKNGVAKAQAALEREMRPVQDSPSF